MDNTPALHCSIYNAPWDIYAFAFSARKDKPARFAIGSFVQDLNNKIRIVDYMEEDRAYHSIAEISQHYPPTKILFLPDTSGSHPDLIASTGDNVKIWEINNGAISAKAKLSNAKTSESCTPITAFDWNPLDLSIIGTASIDTTCTIWDIETQKVKTQLIAHDQEVFDIAFGKDRNTFASVSADGSVRMFDLRALEHSTIIYESPNLSPLLRLSWNRLDSSYLATFCSGSNLIFIIDTRMSSLAMTELQTHTGCINDVMWSPHSSTHIISAAQDKSAFIWDLTGKEGEKGREWPSFPVLSYNAPTAIQSAKWSLARKDLVGLTAANQAYVLKV